VMKPTEGNTEIYGKMAPLLELGAGFDPNYSGYENIYLNAAMMGYPKEFIDSKIDEIIDFSELKDFMDVPVKNYSSGMRARLGFSIATLVDPDILILDEVLSVGDISFRKKSEKKIMSLFEKDLTVVFVSHSLAQVRRLCNKAIWIDSGKIVMNGECDEVCDNFEESINPDTEKAKERQVKRLEMIVKKREEWELLEKKEREKLDRMKQKTKNN